jgi:hypothetical protein
LDKEGWPGGPGCALGMFNSPEVRILTRGPSGGNPTLKRQGHYREGVSGGSHRWMDI